MALSRVAVAALAGLATGAVIAAVRRARDGGGLGGRDIDEQVESDLVIEDSGWAVEQVERVLVRLHHGRPRDQRFDVRIAWLSREAAFTTPSRTITVSRALLDRPGMNDATTALALAHEMAHHDLGHLATGTGIAHALLITRSAEEAADDAAFDHCLRAGYGRDELLRLFDILSMWAADYGSDEAFYDVAGAGWFEKLQRHPPPLERQLRLKRRAPR